MNDIETQILLDWVNTIDESSCLLVSSPSDLEDGNVLLDIIKNGLFEGGFKDLGEIVMEAKNKGIEGRMEMIVEFLTEIFKDNSNVTQLGQLSIMELVGVIKEFHDNRYNITFESSQQEESAPTIQPVSTSRVDRPVTPKRSSRSKEKRSLTPRQRYEEERRSHSQLSQDVTVSYEKNTRTNQLATGKYRKIKQKVKNEPIILFRFEKPSKPAINADFKSVLQFNYSAKTNLLSVARTRTIPVEEEKPKTLVKKTVNPVRYEVNVIAKQNIDFFATDSVSIKKRNVILFWLVELRLIKENSFPLVEVPSLCSNGVLIADLINRLEDVK